MRQFLSATLVVAAMCAPLAAQDAEVTRQTIALGDPGKPATIDVDAGFELAGKTITTARGSLDLAARGIVMGRRIDNLKVAAIVGGGVARAGQALFDPLAEYLDGLEWRPQGHRVHIVPAALGDIAGALGAAHNAMTD
jgi:glucokinase